jgi:hypothetical protein
MGQAEALAAAMTDTLATKQDLREMDARIDARFGQFDIRLTELDKRMDERLSLRLSEQTALLRAEMADLERRMTMRLGGITVAGIGVVSALVKVL